VHVIVSLHAEVLHSLVHLEVRQQVEDVLEVVNDRVIIPEFPRQYILQVDAHLLKLLSERLESLNLISDMLRELPLRGILDVSKKVLHSDLLCLRGANR
jgi:hypothetical protein